MWFVMFYSFCLYFILTVAEIVSVDGDEFREVTVNVALFSNAELRVLAIEGRFSCSPMNVLHFKLIFFRVVVCTLQPGAAYQNN